MSLCLDMGELLCPIPCIHDHICSCSHIIGSRRNCQRFDPVHFGFELSCSGVNHLRLWLLAYMNWLNARGILLFQNPHSQTLFIDDVQKLERLKDGCFPPFRSPPSQFMKDQNLVSSVICLVHLLLLSFLTYSLLLFLTLFSLFWLGYINSILGRISLFIVASPMLPL